jgi:plastocyanin
LRTWIIIVLGGLAVAAAVAVLVVMRTGLSADREPGRVETAVARQLVRLSIPAGQTALQSPLSGPETWRQGVGLFRSHCAMCHGEDGMAANSIGPRMYPPVPDLSSEGIQRFSDGALFAIVRHGVSWTGMPAFGRVLSEADTWKLVAFVRKTPSLKSGDLVTTGGGTSDSTVGVRVVIDGTRFHPDEATINLGESAQWSNADPFPHNVTSESGTFHSEDLAPDGTWVFRPTERGTFEYHCTLHPGMKAVLRVR